MATIKKYTKSNGTTAYQIRLYVGTDLLTGKKQSTTRRGFKTQREARQAAVKIEQAVKLQAKETCNGYLSRCL
ncbi:Arm DNA-binding domain-containing protein [Lactiplantibacillus paraplantarum]|uniref:Arm DNA-binding domain-containing protein n=1 Tax=Lactiplantibacillus paraplantarum TaxID=60520 RepID=UPI003558ED68